MKIKIKINYKNRKRNKNNTQNNKNTNKIDAYISPRNGMLLCNPQLV